MADNTEFYKSLYDDLYSNDYIEEGQESHLYNKDYPEAGLMWHLDKTKIEYEDVLDVGCGVGNGIKHLTYLCKKVRGIDISVQAVKVALNRNLNVVWGSANNIPFKYNTFDLVITTDTLEHLYINDARIAIKELFRVSKKYVGIKVATDKERGTTELLKEIKQKTKKYSKIKNLHLTVRPSVFWINLCNKSGKLIYEHTSFHPNTVKTGKYGEVSVVLIYEK